MTDETLEAALQRLLEQRTQIDQAIAALQQVISGQPSTTGGVSMPASPRPGGGEILVNRGEFFQLSITKAAERVLKRAGRALKTTEILELLRRAEFPMKAQHPEANLYTSLTRSKDFVKVLPNTWALTEWHPEIANQPKTPRKAKRKGRRHKRQKSHSQAEAVAQQPAIKAVV